MYMHVVLIMPVPSDIDILRQWEVKPIRSTCTCSAQTRFIQLLEPNLRSNNVIERGIKVQYMYARD